MLIYTLAHRKVDATRCSSHALPPSWGRPANGTSCCKSHCCLPSPPGPPTAKVTALTDYTTLLVLHYILDACDVRYLIHSPSSPTPLAGTTRHHCCHHLSVTRFRETPTPPSPPQSQLVVTNKTQQQHVLFSVSDVSVSDVKELLVVCGEE